MFSQGKGRSPAGQKRRCVREAGTQHTRQEERMRRVIRAALMFCFCIAVLASDNLTNSLTDWITDNVFDTPMEIL